ncbi:MAG: hypothetical protein ACFE9T_00520 [Promethearchaeota archaeon]
MVNFKGDFWLYTLIAGILGIITLLIPAFGIIEGNNYKFVWVWNLYILTEKTGFIQPDDPLFNIGIATTTLIITGTTILLLTGLIDYLKGKKFNLFKIIGGVLLLIAPIVYLVAIEVEYEGFFWDYFDIYVGTILPFIAGGIAILAGIMDLTHK